jgi:gamma-glutamyl-gamma-aminobutyrate hydrolase PuuD
MRPLIGITALTEHARFGVWELHASLVPLAYVEAVERAGGRPLLVPPSEEGVDETLTALDGLVFSGGSDLDPVVYGADPHPETQGVRPERDRAEIVLLQAAIACDLPILAICRGSQVLNVALGGDLEQHVPEVVGHDGHRQVPGIFSEHDVEVLAETRLHDLLGSDAAIHSHHHQGYRRLGSGLRAAARAADGTVEAIEDASHRFVLGVLWHPEEGDDRRLFEALVDEARAYRATRLAPRP